MSLDNKYQNMMNLINSRQLEGKDELKLLNEMKEYLIHQKNSGRKVIKVICGQKYHIAKKNIVKLEQTCKLIQRKEYALNNIDNSEWSRKIVFKSKKENINHDKIVFDKLLRNLKEKEPLINKSPILNKQYQELKYHLMDSYVDINEKNKLINNFMKENTVTFNFLTGTKKDDYALVENVSELEYEDLKGCERSHKQIIMNDKPITKRNKVPKMFKRIIAGFSAFLMIGICSVVAKSNNSSNKSDKTYTETNTSVTTVPTKTPKKTISKTSPTQKLKLKTKTASKTNVKKVMKSRITKTKKQKNIPKVDKPRIKKININNNKFQLGTKFQVKKNSPIYSNVNSANKKINGQKAYYDNNVVRKSIGLSIEYNKNTVTFVEINKNQYKVLGLQTTKYLNTKEANKEITNLLKKGGKIKSLLSQNNNTYEGYYNKDDVKVLVKK